MQLLTSADYLSNKRQTMTSNNLKRHSQCIGNEEDDPENDSFEPALYGIYDDVLNHATIADDCETFISAKGCGESSSSFKTRDRFFTADRSLTTISIASSVALSDMLSIAKTNDDDLSYITEPDFEEERPAQSMKLSNIIGEVTQASVTDRSRKIIEFGKADPFNLRSVSDERNTLGLGACKDYGRAISDLDVALTSPSIMAPILEFDDDCLKDATLRIISHASFDSCFCDSSLDQFYANDGQ